MSWRFVLDREVTLAGPAGEVRARVYEVETIGSAEGEASCRTTGLDNEGAKHEEGE